MAIKEFLRKLSYEVKRRENPKEFSQSEFYFVNKENKQESLEFGMDGEQLQPEQ